MPQELIDEKTITYRAKRIVEMEKDELIKVIQFMYTKLKRMEDKEINRLEGAFDIDFGK